MTEPIEIKTNSANSGIPIIRIRFDRRDDRWMHHLVLETGHSTLDLMHSLEGSPDQIWPSSPPLQDVSRHSLDQGAAILCVGMAGKSHWSAAFSIEPGADADTIKADLACLQKEPDEGTQLGSTYVLDRDTLVGANTDRKIEIESKDHSTFVINGLEGDGFSTVFELSGQVLKIKPNQISNSPNAATRWGFLMTWQTAE